MPLLFAELEGDIAERSEIKDRSGAGKISAKEREVPCHFIAGGIEVVKKGKVTLLLPLWGNH